MAGRGGARPGAGRKPSAVRRVVHATAIQLAETKIRDRLPWLVDQMIILAEGVEIQKTDARGRTRIWSVPPDRAAIEYLMDRVMGKPKQPVEVEMLEYATKVASVLGADPKEIINLAERRKAS